MNRREFLKFLGGAAAAAAVAPEVLADVVPSGSSGWSGATGVAGPTGVIGPQCPQGPPGPPTIVYDYTMTLQQAIDSMPKEGGMLILPKGTYITGESITIPGNVQIIAEGNLTMAGCYIQGAERPPADAPFTILMDEDDQVLFHSNVFHCEHITSMSDWFHAPVGEALTRFREMIAGLLSGLRSG